LVSDNPNHDIWKITPFIDFPGKYKEKLYRFEWEREWRHVDNFHFDVGDVSMLFIPEDQHSEADQFFLEHKKNNTGPSYFCPYIDPQWDREKIMQVLNQKK